jgi:DNA-3-methyladenine glycosylase
VQVALAGPQALPPSFFQRDVLIVARALLGQVLVSRIGGTEVRVIVTETEAYHQSERGAHTYGGRRTPRTEPMFATGGISYVYFVYGMHWQFNVVTGQQDVGEAVLLRAGVPLTDDDAQIVAARRFGADKKVPKDRAKWADGPAKLTQALGIDKAVNALELAPQQPVWFERGQDVPDAEVLRLPRVGIAYAGEDALLPWRFLWQRPRN